MYIRIDIMQFQAYCCKYTPRYHVVSRIQLYIYTQISSSFKHTTVYIYTQISCSFKDTSVYMYIPRYHVIFKNKAVYIYIYLDFMQFQGYSCIYICIYLYFMQFQGYSCIYVYTQISSSFKDTAVYIYAQIACSFKDTAVYIYIPRFHVVLRIQLYICICIDFKQF